MARATVDATCLAPGATTAGGGAPLLSGFLKATAAALPAWLRPYVACLVGIEAALVGAHVLWPDSAFLDLDREFNLPTWFASGQLLALGIACFAAFEVERRLTSTRLCERLVWLLVGLGFCYLSADESLVLHEKFLRETFARSLAPTSLLHGLVPWQLLFAPALVVGVVAVCTVVYTRLRAVPGAGPIAIGGLGLWGGSVVLEGLAKTIFIPHGLYDLEATLEELAEMLGTTCLLAAAARYAWEPAAGAARASPARSLPVRPILVTAGLLVGVPAALLGAGLWTHRVVVQESAVRALSERPDDVRLWRQLARAALDRKAPATATWAYKRVVRLRARDPYAWNDLGVAYHELGRLPQAATAYRRALVVAPDFDAAIKNLLLAHLQRGDVPAAAVYYRRMVQGGRKARSEAVELLRHFGLSPAALADVPPPG